MGNGQKLGSSILSLGCKNSGLGHCFCIWFGRDGWEAAGCQAPPPALLWVHMWACSLLGGRCCSTGCTVGAGDPCAGTSFRWERAPFRNGPRWVWMGGCQAHPARAAELGVSPCRQPLCSGSSHRYPVASGPPGAGLPSMLEAEKQHLRALDLAVGARGTKGESSRVPGLLGSFLLGC